jgi:hypothetical protein
VAYSKAPNWFLLRVTRAKRHERGGVEKQRGEILKKGALGLHYSIFTQTTESEAFSAKKVKIRFIKNKNLVKNISFSIYNDS